MYMYIYIHVYVYYDISIIISIFVYLYIMYNISMVIPPTQNILYCYPFALALFIHSKSGQVPVGPCTSLLLSMPCRNLGMATSGKNLAGK